MRITKGLENIHAVIDRHEAEWRKEQGEPLEEIKELSLEETVRKRLTAVPENSKGRFSADRFLGTPSKKSQTKKNIKESESESESESQESNVDVVSVIKQSEGKNHSWLYNEVLKAVNDASASSSDKKVKVVAVFVPVVQNGKEFEDLPVDKSVTLPPVNEEDVKVDVSEIIAESESQPEIEIENEISEPVEELPEIPEAEKPEEITSDEFDLLPESQEEPDEELADAFQTMEEKLDEALEEESAEKSEQTEEDEEPEILPHENIETLHLAKVKTQESESESESETEIEEKEVEVGEESEEIEELPLPPLPDDLDEDDEVFDEADFSDPLASIQMIDGELDESEEDEDDEDDNFTLDDAAGLITIDEDEDYKRL